MNKIKLLLASFLTAISISTLALPATALVKAQGDALTCGTQLNLNATGDCKVDEDEANRVNQTLERVVRIFQIVVGIISVMMIIFGGLKYITSGGETNGVKAAKNTILYAVIGLVIVAIAESIVQFVLQRFNE